MFTLPVVYEKHQVGMHINSSQLRFGKNIAQLLKSLFFLFLGTNWSVRGTNTDPGQLCGGQVSGCHSVILFEELFCQRKGGKKFTTYQLSCLSTANKWRRSTCHFQWSQSDFSKVAQCPVYKWTSTGHLSYIYATQWFSNCGMGKWGKTNIGLLMLLHILFN